MLYYIIYLVSPTWWSNSIFFIRRWEMKRYRVSFLLKPLFFSLLSRKFNSASFERRWTRRRGRNSASFRPGTEKLKEWRKNAACIEIKWIKLNQLLPFNLTSSSAVRSLDWYRNPNAAPVLSLLQCGINLWKKINLNWMVWINLNE